VTSNRILRWLAVIPGGVLVAVASTVPCHWLVLFYANFVGKFEEGEGTIGLGLLVRLIGPETVERAGYGFITPFVLIVVAARIAPNFKLATAVAASVMVIVLISAAWLFVPQVDPIPTLIANALTIVAVIVAFTFARSWWERGEVLPSPREAIS
jgi:hypothetical protein